MKKGAVNIGFPEIFSARPATLISAADGRVDREAIIDRITEFLSTDDVYVQRFASNVIIQTLADTSIDRSIYSPFETNGVNVVSISFATASSSQALLPSGPYFIYKNGIYESWRLYIDDLDAFEFSVIQDVIESELK